jgi:hypothetical protein
MNRQILVCADSGDSTLQYTHRFLKGSSNALASSRCRLPRDCFLSFAHARRWLLFFALMKTGRDFFIWWQSNPLVGSWIVAIHDHVPPPGLSPVRQVSPTKRAGTGFLFHHGPVSYFIAFQLSARRWRRSRVVSPVEYVQTRFNRATHLFLSFF